MVTDVDRSEKIFWLVSFSVPSCRNFLCISRQTLLHIDLASFTDRFPISVPWKTRDSTKYEKFAPKDSLIQFENLILICYSLSSTTLAQIYPNKLQQLLLQSSRVHMLKAHNPTQTNSSLTLLSQYPSVYRCRLSTESTGFLYLKLEESSLSTTITSSRLILGSLKPSGPVKPGYSSSYSQVSSRNLMTLSISPILKLYSSTMDACGMTELWRCVLLCISSALRVIYSWSVTYLACWNTISILECSPQTNPWNPRQYPHKCRTLAFLGSWVYILPLGSCNLPKHYNNFASFCAETVTRFTSSSKLRNRQQLRVLIDGLYVTQILNLLVFCLDLCMVDQFLLRMGTCRLTIAPPGLSSIILYYLRWKPWSSWSSGVI